MYRKQSTIYLEIVVPLDNYSCFVSYLSWSKYLSAIKGINIAIDTFLKINNNTTDTPIYFRSSYLDLVIYNTGLSTTNSSFVK